MYLKGNRLFGVVDSFELRTILSFYSNVPISDLIVNDVCISSIDLYKNAENYFTGDSDDHIDGLFDMSCTAMGDNGYYLYFIKMSIGDRLVWSINDGVEIKETILPSGSILEVIHDLN